MPRDEKEGVFRWRFWRRGHLAELERDYLLRDGFEVTVLNRGDEMATWLADNVADLVILDLMLPGRDGLDLCRDLRRQGDVPIIITTAKVEETTASPKMHCECGLNARDIHQGYRGGPSCS